MPDPRRFVQNKRAVGTAASFGRHELGSPGVARGLLEVVAKAALLDVIATGHQVQEQAPAGYALEGGRHVRGQRRRLKARPEGHEELERPGELRQRRRHDPCVLAPRTGRGKRGGEAEALGGSGDETHVADVGSALVAAHHPSAGGANRIAEAQIGSRIAVGRKEPMQDRAHSG